MKLFKLSSFWWLAILASHGWAFTLLQVLQTYPQLSALNTLVNSNANATALTALLVNASNFTFLAPSNTAISTFNSQNPGLLNSTLLLPTIQYGLLKGQYPTVLITNTPQFIQSNLFGPAYANVTGGQVVELVTASDGTPQFISGNRSISKNAAADVVCAGGIVHIIDTVLSIPLPLVQEITNAGLNDFVAILSADNYLAANATYVNQVLDLPDVTYFMPNSASALAVAQQLAKNSSAAELEANFQYYVVPEFAAYSSMLTNGMKLKTQQGTDLTVTLQDGDIYINSAKILISDLIVSNGVGHVLDDLLNRFDTAGPPPPTSSSTPSTPTPTAQNPAQSSMNMAAASTGGGMGTGAKIGLGVGVGIAGLLILSALLFFLVRHRKQSQVVADNAPWDNSSMSGATASPLNKFYVQRGQVQRQEDPGLGLQSTGMQHFEDSPPIGTALGRKESIRESSSKFVQIDGPTIPPRSPSRVQRGDGKSYF